MTNLEFLEMCNKAFKATLEQKEISVRQGICAYLDDNGNRCIVGHMLTEEQCKEADKNEFAARDVCDNIALTYLYRKQRAILADLEEAYDQQLYGGTRQAYINQVYELLKELQE